MEKTGRATLIFFLIILVASSLASLWMIRLFFVSVMVGGLLAMMTKTYYVKLNNRKIWPSISAFLVTIGIILLVIIPFSIFVAVAAKQGVQIGKSLAQSGSFSLESVVNWIASWPGVSLLGIAPEDLSVSLLDWLETGAKSATSFAVGFVAQIPDALLQLALACIACYFFLVDGGKFLDWMRSRVPLDKDVRNRVVSSFESMAVASVWATLAAGAAQSAVIFTSFLILGVQGAFLAAGATFIFAWIPFIGSTPAWVIGAIYLYTLGAFGKVALMILFGLFAGIVDNILRPIVLRGRSDMHPLISLVSIFGGLAWFGIMGVFIGPLLAAVTLSLLEAWPDVANRYGLGYGREPGDAD
jgi:predicted PurR-regulated permease PerM